MPPSGRHQRLSTTIKIDAVDAEWLQRHAGLNGESLSTELTEIVSVWVAEHRRGSRELARGCCPTCHRYWPERGTTTKHAIDDASERWGEPDGGGREKRDI